MDAPAAPVTHRRLNELLDAVLALMSRNRYAEVLAAWRVFEREVRLHLAVEESRVVPAYARVDRVDADSIEQEHDAVRDAMRDCRHRLEAQESDPAALEEVLRVYRAHQEHEESGMYAWAIGGLPPMADVGSRASDPGAAPTGMKAMPKETAAAIAPDAAHESPEDREGGGAEEPTGG